MDMLNLPKDVARCIRKKKELDRLCSQAATLDEERAIRNTAARGYWSDGALAPARVADFVIPSGDFNIEARVAFPATSDPVPVLIFAHGGGWVYGAIEDDAYLHGILTHNSGIAVLSFNYRLAPEHPFPAAIEDFKSVHAWVRQHGHTMGLNGQKVALGGASAGANLAISTIMDLRDSGEVLPSAQVLFYGVYGCDFETSSYREFGSGESGTSRAGMKLFFERYTQDERLYAHPLVTPLNGEVRGLPPTWLAGAGIDTLRDDTIMLAKRLRAASVHVTEKIYEDLPHGFVSRARMLDGAKHGMEDCKSYLLARFSLREK